MTSWKVFVAQLLTIIAGKSQTRKWALDKGVGLSIHADAEFLSVRLRFGLVFGNLKGPDGPRCASRRK